jgi:hypothetical protein
MWSKTSKLQNFKTVCVVDLFDDVFGNLRIDSRVGFNVK